MNDPQAPENVEARASQEDPIIMYLIVRESLNMGVGKTAAQCAHASQMLLLKYLGLQQSFDYTAAAHDEPHMKEAFYSLVTFKTWLDSSFRKVVLKADDKEWAKLKEAMTPMDVVVVDAGLTEIEPGSETVIGLHPVNKSLVSKVVKRLQVLK